jgi:hypothetical protein
MTGIPHVTLNRERKGGIVEFVAVGSETKERRFNVTVVVAGYSRRRRDAAGGAKTNSARNSSIKSKQKGSSSRRGEDILKHQHK